ncbi:MAG: hypothetical protein IJQ63_11600, partial [Synergistaceae bacterium]|nr:hypothetical protein [Synergistaceae bacterium]
RSLHVRYRNSILVILIFISAFLEVACAEQNLIEVQASGRGSSRTQAFQNAIEEAVRKNVGALIMSREILSNDLLIENIIQVSRADIQNAEILSERTEKGEVLLELKFKINKDIIDNALRKTSYSSGGGGAVSFRQRNYLERGLKAVNNFFSELELLDFINVDISDRSIDLNKSQLSLNIKIKFNNQKYFEQFAPSLTLILDNILNKELEPELETSSGSKLIYLSGHNRDFRGWLVPDVIFSAIIKSLNLDFKQNQILRTQRRLWINLALINAQGREMTLRRIPVQFPVTNILFFNLNNNLMIAPIFAVNDKNLFGSGLLLPDLKPADALEQRFIFELPREILTQISSIASWINLEE